MKSIANQYLDLKEGRMSQFNFMRSLRMTMPQYITNVTSFNDAVRILKNKAILNEGMDDEEELNAMIAKAEKEKEEEEAIKSGFGIQDPLEEDRTDDELNQAFLTFLKNIYAKSPTEKIAQMIADQEAKMGISKEEIPGFEGTRDALDSLSIREGRKKKEPKKELHPNQIHPQELRMGMRVELEHTDDLDKAKKIALDHLAENPFYYTALKLAGVESPSAPKVKAPVEKKAKKRKEAVELVDKINAMQKVKMPKIVKENLNEAGGEFMFSGTLTDKEAAELRRIAPGVEIEQDELDDTYKTVISHPMYNEKTLRHAVKQATGQLSPVADKKDLGASFDKFKSKLEEIVREAITEYYDGRDNLTDVE